MNQHTLTPFEEAVRYFGIDLHSVRLYCTAQTLHKQECALLYVGPDQAGREAVAQLASWLFPWLDERRRDITRLHRAHDVAGACEQIRLFAGPTEVLRELGPWGSLGWIFALQMVGGLVEQTTPYAHAYFEGGKEMLGALLGITATSASWQVNAGRPARPACETLLARGLPPGDSLKHLLISLTPDEQMRLLEQLVSGAVDTFRYPFDPLTY